MTKIDLSQTQETIEILSEAYLLKSNGGISKQKY